MKNGTENNASVNKDEVKIASTLQEFFNLPGSEQTLDNFKKLPHEEQEMFKSMLVYIFNKQENFFMYAKLIIEIGKANDYFKYVKFGSEITGAERDLHVSHLSNIY